MAPFRYDSLVFSFLFKRGNLEICNLFDGSAGSICFCLQIHNSVYSPTYPDALWARTLDVGHDSNEFSARSLARRHALFDISTRPS